VIGRNRPGHETEYPMPELRNLFLLPLIYAALGKAKTS
jgi:hypothetical protein